MYIFVNCDVEVKKLREKTVLFKDIDSIVVAMILYVEVSGFDNQCIKNLFKFKRKEWL